MNVRPVAALVLCLLGAACGQKTEDGATAAAVGEVLPGSISDAMIDLDTSTASPPMAPVRADPAKKAAPSASGAADEEAPSPATSPATPGVTIPVIAPARSTDTQ